MQAINTKMKDLFTGKEIERRIDISNITRPDYNAPTGWECDIVEPDPERQRAMIERWIVDCANDQHETLLELVSWEII